MADGKLTVSVVIPTYDRAQLIERALNSALSQTYPDLEVIVVDDGSTDDTWARVRSIQHVDQRVQYLKHAENRGAQAARNTGIAAAHGSFIAFLDSDDEWLPEKLIRQMDRFTGDSLLPGVVYCGFVRVAARGERLAEYMPLHGGRVYHAALRDWLADTNTIVARKEILQLIGGFDERIAAHQEWDLCIRLARVCEFDFVPECLTLYHEHDLPSISKDSVRDAGGYLQVLHAHRTEILRSCGTRAVSVHYLRAARLFVEAQRLDLARAMLRQSIRWDPLNATAILHLAASLLGSRGYDSLRSGKQRAESLFRNRRLQGLTP